MDVVTGKDSVIPKDAGKSLLQPVQPALKRAGYGAGNVKGMLILLWSCCQTLLRMKGAFPSQGSVDDEISLGAYVAAALLELGLPLKVSTLLLLLLSCTLPCLGTAQPIMLSISRPGTGRELL